MPLQPLDNLSSQAWAKSLPASAASRGIMCPSFLAFPRVTQAGAPPWKQEIFINRTHVAQEVGRPCRHALRQNSGLAPRWRLPRKPVVNITANRDAHTQMCAKLARLGAHCGKWKRDSRATLARSSARTVKLSGGTQSSLS